MNNHIHTVGYRTDTPTETFIISGVVAHRKSVILEWVPVWAVDIAVLAVVFFSLFMSIFCFAMTINGGWILVFDEVMK